MPIKAFALLIEASTHDNRKDEEEIKNNSDKEYSLRIYVEPAEVNVEVGVKADGSVFIYFLQKENNKIIKKCA